MRYYLDTNTLAFILFYKNREANLDRQASEIIRDYESIFYVSTVVMRELLLLYKSGSFSEVRYNSYKDYKAIFSAISELGYEIMPVTVKHLHAYAELVPAYDHNDPADHMIIAQAISDRIPLISCDKKFKNYTSQGLSLVFNRR
jgi:PIN domain nuclease of toxin-antitoxin system